MWRKCLLDRPGHPASPVLRQRRNSVSSIWSGSACSTNYNRVADRKQTLWRSCWILRNNAAILFFLEMKFWLRGKQTRSFQKQKRENLYLNKKSRCIHWKRPFFTVNNLSAKKLKALNYCDWWSCVAKNMMQREVVTFATGHCGAMTGVSGSVTNGYALKLRIVESDASIYTLAFLHRWKVSEKVKCVQLPSEVLCWTFADDKSSLRNVQDGLT